MLVYSLLDVADSPLVEIVRVRYADAVGHCDSNVQPLFLSHNILFKIFYANIFCSLENCTDIRTMLMTITDYAAKRHISAATIYSWIYRNQTEKNGFEVIKIGKVTLIKELTKKKKITT